MFLPHSVPKGKASGTSPSRVLNLPDFGALWAENCVNFLAGKTEVFSGKFTNNFYFFY
jgi:hypothetical protein